jgi:hypothetical protein
MKYNRATPVFHQWRDSRGANYGLQFSSQGDADLFGNAVNKAFDILSGEVFCLTCSLCIRTVKMEIIGIIILVSEAFASGADKHPR